MTEYRRIQVKAEAAYERWRAGELTDQEMQTILKGFYEDVLKIEEQKKTIDHRKIYQFLLPSNLLPPN